MKHKLSPKAVLKWAEENPRVTSTKLSSGFRVNHPADPPEKLIQAFSYIQRIKRETGHEFKRHEEVYQHNRLRYLYDTADVVAYAIDHGCTFAKTAEMLGAEKAAKKKRIQEELSVAIANGKHMLGQMVNHKISTQRFLSHNEIVHQAIGFEESMGIYFLIDGFEVVYVGQSVNVPARVHQHKNDPYCPKEFNRYAWIPCPKEALDLIESIYILSLQPKYNNGDRDVRKSLPISYNDFLNVNVSKSRSCQCTTTT